MRTGAIDSTLWPCTTKKKKKCWGHLDWTADRTWLKTWWRSHTAHVTGGGQFNIRGYNTGLIYGFSDGCDIRQGTQSVVKRQIDEQLQTTACRTALHLTGTTKCLHYLKMENYYICFVFFNPLLNMTNGNSKIKVLGFFCSLLEILRPWPFVRLFWRSAQILIYLPRSRTTLKCVM